MALSARFGRFWPFLAVSGNFCQFWPDPSNSGILWQIVPLPATRVSGDALVCAWRLGVKWHFLPDLAVSGRFWQFLPISARSVQFRHFVADCATSSLAAKGGRMELITWIIALSLAVWGVFVAHKALSSQSGSQPPADEPCKAGSQAHQRARETAPPAVPATKSATEIEVAPSKR